jgi:hypothetical protein
MNSNNIDDEITGGLILKDFLSQQSETEEGERQKERNEPKSSTEILWQCVLEQGEDHFLSRSTLE